MLSQQVAEKGTVSHPFFFHGVFLLTKNTQPPFLLHCTSGVGSSSSSPSPCALPYQNSAVSMSLHSLGETMTESHTPLALSHRKMNCLHQSAPACSLSGFPLVAGLPLCSSNLSTCRASASRAFRSSSSCSCNACWRP